MVKSNKHQTEVRGDNIIISLNIDQLIFGIENNPEFPCKITDKNKFAQYISDNFFEFVDPNGHDSPLSPIFLKYFDNIAIGAYESNEEFIKMSEEDY